jgi:putative heme-binding domain-containing protein
MPTGDLARLSSNELAKLLEHPNRWHRQTALRLLADCRDDKQEAWITVGGGDGREELDPVDGVWAMFQSNAWDEQFALDMLASPKRSREWTIRLMGDGKFLPSKFLQSVIDLARTESEVDVLCQLACTARRLPPEQALPILGNLLRRSQFIDDPRFPLLVWWALEANIQPARDAVLALFDDHDLWREPLVEKEILPRLMRRFAATGQRADLAVCAKLLKMSPTPESTKALMQGFEDAFAGRSMSNIPAELVEALSKAGGGSLSLRVRQGDADAIQEALATIADPNTPSDRRSGLILLFGEVKQPDAVPVLLDVLIQASDDAAKAAAMAALAAYNDERIAATVLNQYGQMTDDLRNVAQGLLVSRKAWAKDLLSAVDAGKIAAASLPDETVRKLSIHNDDEIAALIKKHFGEVAGASTEEMQAQLEKYLALLAETSEENPGGDPYPGKALYMQMCGKCHKLHDAGGEIGPDLTAFKRDDVRQMLINIINPSAEIREGFETFIASTVDGRVVTGFLVEQDTQVIVLRTAEGQTVTLDRSDIDELLPQKKSIMPEGQLKTLTDAQVRDLFAYLRSGQPLPN